MIKKIKKSLIVLSLCFIFISCDSSESLTINFPTNDMECESIIIEIKGAVNIPGIYSVEKGVMLYEVVNLAGGLSKNADRESINLIQIFEVNTSIIVPYINNNSSILLININTAELSELMTLKGIGEAKATAIIEYRKNNRFMNIEDIMKVSGISETVFNKIKDQITV